MMKEAIDILETLPMDTQEQLRNEYETLVKVSMKQGFNVPNPNEWLASKPLIAKLLHGSTQWTPNPELFRRFQAIMVPAGFGSIVERARWYVVDGWELENTKS